MDTALVIDGFPRGDIDVVGVRLVRVKIIRLRNDLRDLLGLLEKKLAEQFSQVKQDLVNAQHEVSTEGEISPDPFATVTLVVENGPAYNSGLREGDRLVSFANVNIGTEDKLSKIAVITRSSLEKRIEVVVKRDSETKRISLVPTENWSGRGVLGCQLKID